MSVAKPLHTDYGITVKQLKEYVKDLPETDANGEDFTVWCESPRSLSGPVYTIMPLNPRPEGQDLLLEG